MGETHEALPEGCELRLDVYLVSDSTGIEACVGLGAIRSVAPVAKIVKDPDALRETVAGIVGGMTEIAPDLRPMTRNEIEDYKRRQDDGEQEEGDDEEEGN